MSREKFARGIGITELHDPANVISHSISVQSDFLLVVDFKIFLGIFQINVMEVYILKISKNATHVFAISFQHGLFNQSFVFIRQLYFKYYFKRLFCLLIDCRYALFKIICTKTSYLTPCNVPLE